MAIIPGKWEVFRRASGVTVVQSTHGGEEYMVARCYGDGDGDEVSTASLIAAAPDMLDALRAVKSEFIDMYEECYPNDESDNDVTAAIDMVIAAIAKAEGRADEN